jgi:outer membrane protein assembly factor BamB
MRGVAKWLVMMVVAALAGCAAQAGRPVSDFRDLQANDVLAKVGWQYYWSMPSPSFFQPGESVERLYRVGDAVCTLTNHNRLIAYEAATGRVRWSLVVAPEGQDVFEPVFVKDMSLHETVPGLKTIVDSDAAPMARLFDAVVVGMRNSVIVINAMTGHVVRDEATGRFKDVSSGTSGCADAKRYYGVTAKGLCFAFDLDAGIHIWNFGGYSGVVAPLREFGGQVFLGNRAGEIMAAQADKSRNLNWMRSIPEPILAPFSISKRGLFVAGEEGGVYAFEPFGGKPMWQEPFYCKGRLIDPIQVSGRTVFQHAEGDTFYAISLVDGKKRWTMKDGRLVLAIVGDDACVLDSRRVLHVVNEETGKEKWALPLTGMDVFLPGTGTEGIWAATRDGRVVCLRPLAAGRLTLDKLEAP